jgi:hypothetical protein
VPKFGDWDSNPASADGYTHIFNKVREEKSTQAKAPAGFDKDAGPRGRGNGPRQHDDGYVSSVSSTVHYLMLSRRGHWLVHACWMLAFSSVDPKSYSLIQHELEP